MCLGSSEWVRPALSGFIEGGFKVCRGIRAMNRIAERSEERPTDSERGSQRQRDRKKHREKAACGFAIGGQ